MSGHRHGWRLFAFNLVLFGAVGAFAGMEVLDFLPGGGDELVGVGLLVIAAAVVSTRVHLRAGRWTSVDNMAERLSGHSPSKGNR